MQMKILMIAPEPFFQPRGTPFSEYYRIRCLSELGHQVDLVTYPIGDDVDIPGLRIFRPRNLAGIRDVKIGPSLVKIPLDIQLFRLAWSRAATGEYDVIHSHEEGGLMAVFLSKMYGLPHIYDMHSSLPQQLENFRFTKSRIIRAAFEWIEGTMLATADAVIAICPSLADKVREVEPKANVSLIENTAESHEVDDLPMEEIDDLRRQLELKEKKVILYIGTFETYQGLGLLLEAAEKLLSRRDDALLLLVGGRKSQVEEIRARAESLGISHLCRFTGMVPHKDVPHYLKLADVLVSPRRYGTNTPLKIYSYLRSGKPIVATDLYTHTQVLNRNAAMLVQPAPTALAEGIEAVLDDQVLAKKLSDAAFRLSEEKYSYRQYVEKTRAVFDYLGTLAHA